MADANKPTDAAREQLKKLGANPFVPRELPQVIGGLLDHIDQLGARIQTLENGRFKSESGNRNG